MISKDCLKSLEHTRRSGKVKLSTKRIIGLDRVTQFLKHSHELTFEDIEQTKLSDNSIRMRTIGCTAQKAVKKEARAIIIAAGEA